MKLAVVLFSFVVIGAAGCEDGHDHSAYTTYQACFDQHTMKEKLPLQEAIVVCCLDHPIDGVSPACGDTKPDCINYLTANLNQTSASTTEVMDACTEYVSQKSM
jgi:hypothetical protein